MDEETIDTFKAMKEVRQIRRSERAKDASRFRRDVARIVIAAGMQFVPGKPDHPVWHVRDRGKVMVTYWPSTTAIRFHPRLKDKCRAHHMDVKSFVGFLPRIIEMIVEVRAT